MSSGTLFARARKQKWVWISLAALAAIQLYFVQEMIAALLLFTVLFSLVAGIVLIGFLVNRASQRTLKWAEPQSKQMARYARRGVALFESISKRPLHRLR